MSTSIVTSKHNALLNVAGQTARSIPDLEHAWLSNELGLTSGNSTSLPDLWRLYLVAFGIEEASIVTMIDEWLTEGGYTGSGALQEMWEDKAALLFSVLSPQASGEISVEPINGQGSATFVRTGEVAHVRDHDNVQRKVQANEARIQGARRVKNELTYSNAFTNAAWPKTTGGTGVEIVITPDYATTPNGLSASRLECDRGTPDGSSNFSLLQRTFPLIEGSRNISLWMKLNSGTSEVVYFRTDSDQTVTITDSWQRLTVSGTGATNYFTIGNRGGNGTSQTIDFLVAGAQFELDNGASNQVPSEYIPTTSATVAKYFWKTNGNSVASNVVTEATGIPLHPVTLKAGQNVFARYDTREDSTAYVVGDKRIFAAGSGTAGGNGFAQECVTAGTTSASEPTPTVDTVAEELLLNTIFSSSIDDWAGTRGGTIAWNSNGGMDVTFPNPSDWGGANQGRTTVIGREYVVVMETTADDGAAEHYAYKSDSQSAHVNLVGSSIATSGTGIRTFTFTATATTTYIGVTHNSGSDTDEDTITIGSISCKEAIVDGTVVWIQPSHYKLAGYLGEPASTNSLIRSRQFDTGWSTLLTPILTQDQDGIDGVANTAWTIEDNDGAGYEAVQQSHTIPNDSNALVTSIYILKDSDTSRFAQLNLVLSGGTVQQIKSMFNTQTGAVNDVTVAGTVSSNVEDLGLWWRLSLTVANNSTGNVTAVTTFYPAVSSAWGSYTPVTGTAVIDQAQLELNTSVPSSPIITTTLAVTRNADDLYYDDHLVDAQGAVLYSFLFEDETQASNARVLGDTVGNFPLAFMTATPAVACYDGTNQNSSPAITEDTFNQMSLRWETSTNQSQSGANGASGDSGDYDGSWNASGLDILSYGAGLGRLQGIISDIRIYKTDLGQTRAESLTSAD